MKPSTSGGARDVAGQNFPVSAFVQPPYSYKLDKAGDVPEIVKRDAGRPQ